MTWTRIWLMLICSAAMAAAFQNCGASEFSGPEGGATDPNANIGNGNTTDGNTDTGTGTGTGTGDGTGTVTEIITIEEALVSLNLNEGDSVTYQKWGGFIFPRRQDSVVLANPLGQILVTTESQQEPIMAADADPEPDLPESYCKNSVLPHCRHLSEVPCTSTYCDGSKVPVVCSEQKPVTVPEAQDIFDLISGIRTQEKKMVPGEPMIADCGGPDIRFAKEGEDPIWVSMADRACVSDGALYVIKGGGPLRDAMDDRFDDLADLGEFCNLFRNYHRQDSTFEYSATSGFTLPEFAYSYNVKYLGNQRADLQFRRPGDAELSCASNVFVTASQLQVFFPDGGLNYRVLKTSSTLADASVSRITYKHESYGDSAEVGFFLDSGSAYTFTGGAILHVDHKTAMVEAVDALVKKVVDNGSAGACP